MGGIRQVAPGELQHRISAAEPVYLLDVREPWEFALCAIPGAVNIPLGEITEHLDSIPRDRPVVCICHHGVRSQHVASYLIHHGHPSVENLIGGVEAWANEVDTGMARY